MVRIGKLTDYALVITNHLVATANQLCTIDEIGQATHIPLATNRKLLKKLVDAGIVSSFRGSRGGYKLSKPANSISVADVINAVEGPISLTECATKKSACKISQSCSLKENWRFLNNFFLQNLQKISLYDMSQNQLKQSLDLDSIV